MSSSASGLVCAIFGSSLSLIQSDHSDQSRRFLLAIFISSLLPVRYQLFCHTESRLAVPIRRRPAPLHILPLAQRSCFVQLPNFVVALAQDAFHDEFIVETDRPDGPLGLRRSFRHFHRKFVVAVLADTADRRSRSRNPARENARSPPDPWPYRDGSRQSRAFRPGLQFLPAASVRTHSAMIFRIADRILFFQPRQVILESRIFSQFRLAHRPAQAGELLRRRRSQSDESVVDAAERVRRTDRHIPVAGRLRAFRR